MCRGSLIIDVAQDTGRKHFLLKNKFKYQNAKLLLGGSLRLSSLKFIECKLFFRISLSMGIIHGSRVYLIGVCIRSDPVLKRFPIIKKD
jgi:hypothetical protein